MAIHVIVLEFATLVILPVSFPIVVAGGLVGVRRDDAPAPDVFRFVPRVPAGSFFPRLCSALFPEGGRFSSMDK